MDDIDRLQERDEPLHNALLAVRKPVLPTKGSCYNCDEPLPSGFYCDADCREDHELEVRLKRQQPRLR